MTQIDLEKARREQLRWLILMSLNVARPVGAADAILLTCVTDVIQLVTLNDLRRELGYLNDRGLITIDKKGFAWHAKLTRDGVDIAEYTVDCEPGIARPEKYW